MRRRSRSNPINMMTAVLVELGTMVGIIALAQPTWTRGVIEHVSAPAASSMVETATANTGVNAGQRVQAGGTQLNPVAQWQTLSGWNMPATTVPAAAWNQAAALVARVDATHNIPMANVPDARFEPVLPPPAAAIDYPQWSSNVGWSQPVTNNRY